MLAQAIPNRYKLLSDRPRWRRNPFSLVLECVETHTRMVLLGVFFLGGG